MTVSDNFYDNAGGENFFTQLVDHFYTGVAADPVLRPMYAGADLTAARRHLTLFLMQYWGGPGTYQEERGHPRLRMRHMPFVIDGNARDHWISCMKAALLQMEIESHLRDELWTYLVSAAYALTNTEDAVTPSS
ncbi:MAG: globin [Actinomycetes bacterium]